MSPIRVWDGYQWRQPQFWTGSSWRRQQDYVPYDPGVPATPPTNSLVGSWTFDSNTTEGWYNSTFNNDASEPYPLGGGVIRQDQLESGLFGRCDMSSPDNQVELPIGTAYRARAAINITRRSGSLPNTKFVNLSVAQAELALEMAEGSTGWTEYTTPFAYTQYSWTTFAITLGVSAGSLDANSLYTVDVDWARIEDGNGNPLYWQSDPGDPGIPPTPEVPAWPYWWDGSQWRG